MKTNDLEFKLGVFIDTQNIYHSAKNLYHARVNFNELIKFISSKGKIIKSLAYVIKSDPATGEESFFEALKKTGIDLRIKELQVYPDGTKKGDWDVGITVDAIRFAYYLDKIVLVTGDGDFVPLIQYLKWGLDKEVIVIGFEETTSHKIKEVADEFIEIENIPKVLLRVGQNKRLK
jgi:uncharacterized protein (TIGR00288 family)